MEKVSELNVLRYSLVVIAVGLAVYTGTGVYDWGSSKMIQGSGYSYGQLLGMVVGLVIIGVGSYYSLSNTKAVAFVNETEAELRKVVWPKAKPFAASTELWHYTIAIIVLMVVLVSYIGVVDFVINLGLKNFILTQSK
ncbi:MAG: preprotein translocase subunit SecE [Planctomycetota bacterium]|nr:MAG: preprotein translocase subunit SecE [Planctomycetota bacterium]